MKPEVSVIIPLYNRAEYIEETLNSICAQTFDNWECIVVDDHSDDDGPDIVRSFVKRDDRIKFYRRPDDRKKGANACRNFGFEKSVGEFVIFFDSDDVMLANCLELNLSCIQNSNSDYVITRTDNFGKFIDNPHEQNAHKNYYKFHLFPLTHFNYVTQRLNWLTPDLFVKRSVISSIRFNENLNSGQEYNFNCKLTVINTNGKFLNRVTSSRRIHNNSIQGTLNKNSYKRIFERFQLNFLTWQDLRALNIYKQESTSLNFLFSGAVRDSLIESLRIDFRSINSLTREMFRGRYFITALSFWIYHVIKNFTGRGHFFRKIFIREWEKIPLNNFERHFYPHD
ncbi:glycosyltransferase [Flavobacteriaceae bacterium]|nr:glycosyltransferase [Flavobacteriaceae bacterium]